MAYLDKCALCGSYGELKNSHVIGNSVFKKISRKNNGKLIAVAAKSDRSIRYTQDSWDAPLLCCKCEILFNSKFEAYGLNVLRGRPKPQLLPHGIRFVGIDQSRLSKYFLSIVWRAFHSKHPAYSNVTMLEKDSEFLRRAFLNDHEIPNHRYSIKIGRVHDLRLVSTSPRKSTKELIVPPFCRVSENPINVSVCMLFEGFFVEVFYKALSLKERNNGFAVLNKNKTELFVPYINLFDIDEVVRLIR